MTESDKPRVARLILVWVAGIAVAWALLLGVLRVLGVW